MVERDASFEPATTNDFAAVLSLVREAGLPTADLEAAFPAGFAVLRVGSELVAVAGLERHGSVGLLRSVAVHASQRNAGYGQRLVADRLRAAEAQGLDAVYLLTTTAPDYFRRLGFTDAHRADAPPELQRSSEFASVCPASAHCLVKRLR